MIDQSEAWPGSCRKYDPPVLNFKSGPNLEARMLSE